MKQRFFLIAVLLCLAYPAIAKTWRVGPGRQYTAPSKVMSLVSNGDTVEIDPGLYVKDVGAWNADSLVLRCSTGYAHLDAQGTAAQRKAIWVINGKHNYVEGIEFSGCAISFADGDNGAGIRLQSNSFGCRRCYFHDNQEGILTGNDTTTEITVEACEFDHNGVEGTSLAGFEHNIYIGHSRIATVKYCYFHRSIVGHELKTRANVNYILYNHIVDGPDGDGSYSIDIPNGGLAFVIGNSIEKGPNASNSTIFCYGEEGIINPDSELYFVNNTVVTDRNPTRLDTIKPGAKAILINNIFAGNMHPLNPTADTVSNVITSDVSFFHFRNAAAYDYQPTAAFPGMTSTTDPGSAHGFSLRPISSYVDPLDSMSRNDQPLQIGAFPFQAPQAVERSAIILPASVYPNPLQQSGMIAVPATFAGDHVSLELLDATGALARRDVLPVVAGTMHFERGSLMAGVYYYRIIAEGGDQLCCGSIVITP